MKVMTYDKMPENIRNSPAGARMRAREKYDRQLHADVRNFPERATRTLRNRLAAGEVVERRRERLRTTLMVVSTVAAVFA